MLRLSAAIISAISLLPVTPGVHRHDVAPELHIELASDPAFRSVGLLTVEGEVVGSSVLVAPGWVATAAHVVEGRDASELTLQIGDQRSGVTQIVIHPDFQHERFADHEDAQFRKGLDVALLKLDGPMAGVTPAVLLDGDPPIGSVGTFVGYGTSGTSTTAITRPDPAGTLRAGHNRIDAFGGTVRGRPIPDWYLVTDFDHPDSEELNRTGPSDALPLEYMPIGGDSGGGFFVRLDDGWRLVGLVAGSRVAINDDLEADGLYGSLNFATRIDLLVDWIAETIQ